MIAQHAGTAIGTLYGFFPNKETIALRLNEQFCSDIRHLYEEVLTDQLVQLSLSQLIDCIIDPLIMYHQTHPGFQSLWLQAQNDPRLRTLEHDLNETLAQKTAGIFSKRYPQYGEASALLYSRICMRTVQALTSLALREPEVNLGIIAELKIIIRTYLQATLALNEENASKNPGNEIIK